MKRYLSGIIAVVIAISAVAFTAPNRDITPNPKMLNFYFQFTGPHGQEADESLWDEISLTTYNSLTCSGSKQGCKITTNNVVDPTQNFPDREISSVTVNSNSVPQQTMDNTEVKNKP